MKLEDLPPPDDRTEIVRFARLFNGYEYYGSLNACAEAARTSKRKTLIDLQTELFWAFRSSHHLGTDDVMMECYKELLPHFERILSGS